MTLPPSSLYSSNKIARGSYPHTWSDVFQVRGAAKKKNRFFLGDLSQICLPTHLPQGFCEIWENERWNLGRKRRFSGQFGGVLKGLDLVWESATPPTHIWERSPKKNRFFFLAAPLNNLFSFLDDGFSKLEVVVQKQMNEIAVYKGRRRVVVWPQTLGLNKRSNCGFCYFARAGALYVEGPHHKKNKRKPYKYMDLDIHGE